MKQEQLESGVFCQLKIGRWDAMKRIPTKKLGRNIPKEIIRARQDVIEDRTLLKDLSTIRRSAKGLLVRNSLPFPIDGVFWLPKDKIVYIDDEFKKFQKEYERRLENLCSSITKMEKNFKERYPLFYNKDNYPSPEKIRKKYYFYWNFFHFAVPSKKAKILSPALYKREHEKFNRMVKQMEEMTVDIIGNMLLRRIDRLANQCEAGKINQGTVNSVNRFLERWEGLWKSHVDETKMKSIIKDLQGQMNKTSADRLQDNESFRNKAQAKFEDVVKKIKAVPNFNLKRKLDV